MAYPSDSDFNLYDGSLITNVQWDSNFQKIPILWSSGTYDINVNQITAGTYVGLPSDNFTGTTGESVTAGDILRLEGGLLYKATVYSSDGVTSVVGISTTTTAAGLTATVASDYYKTILFEFRLCNKSGNCKSGALKTDEEIDEWLKDINVVNWY